ncbi:hypothetical protein [Coleofasciculus sp. G2-EDA-02]|uniref:hypothetical protein n=1 Tax=Coleofasciculus sp. G2-EDA-02 TaxID=3069529 RepID=UPI0032FCBC7B
MTSHPNIVAQLLFNNPRVVRQQRRRLLQAFWIIVTLICIFEFYTLKTRSLVSILCAIIILFFALLPAYLWCSGKALGLPIFPIFALTHIGTYAIPLVSKHPKVIVYPPEAHLFASITVVVCLGLATLIWFSFVKTPPPLPQSYRAFNEQSSDKFFLFILAAGVFFNMYSLGGWFFIDGGLFSLIRSVILGLNVLAIFTLSFQAGAGKFSKQVTRIFFSLLAAYMITTAASLLLFSAASIFIIATVAFILGSQRLPVLPIIIVVTCLSLLHSGKADMRAKYWFGSQNHFVQPWEYPAWYAEWVGYSLDYYKNQRVINQSGRRTQSEDRSSSLERISVIHMLLLAQSKTPETVTYLQGKTYTILPQLVIPRFLNPNKIRSHEGTYILSIHYGLQTHEATLTTTIGWGLLAEAYANFGLFGCTGLAIVLGAFYGKATSWSMHTPLISSRSLFAVVLISCAVKTEWSAGVYFAALFQSSIVLVAITFVFMKAYRIKNVIDMKRDNKILNDLN